VPAAGIADREERPELPIIASSQASRFARTAASRSRPWGGSPDSR
jgi:hypothetical protein